MRGRGRGEGEGTGNGNIAQNDSDRVLLKSNPAAGHTANTNKYQRKQNKTKQNKENEDVDSECKESLGFF